MRIPSYLSPSSLAIWESNPEEFYLSHLSEVRAPRIPQTNYMAVGSAVDAYIKSAMFESIFGKGVNLQFEFTTLFEEQVESQNRDWALENGAYVFDCYKISGAYDELLTLVKESPIEPQFETKITGDVERVPLLGKPDLRFFLKSNTHVILDFKCNGYCSKSATSPAKYYKLCRDGWTPEVTKATVGAGESHKNYRPVMYKGMEIHAGFLEEASSDWADQLSIYAWILGESVGDESVIFCVDQFCGKPKQGLEKPLLRIANHRSRISRMYQQVLIGRIHDAWNRITSGHIFKDMSREDNDARCAVLDQQALTNYAIDSDVAQMSRKVGY